MIHDHIPVPAGRYGKLDRGTAVVPTVVSVPSPTSVRRICRRVEQPDVGCVAVQRDADNRPTLLLSKVECRVANAAHRRDGTFIRPACPRLTPLDLWLVSLGQLGRLESVSPHLGQMPSDEDGARRNHPEGGP